MRTCPQCQRAYADDMDFCPRDATALVDSGAWAEGVVVRGKYKILAKLGEGGMGAVYKAMHLRFGEVRALKVMSAKVAGDPLFVKRFEHEGVITRKLQHANAVRVDDIDETEDGRPFIVMEFIEGRSLKQVIRSEGPLAAPRVCAIVKQVAAALGAAHAIGMVHRDIKPDNIVLLSQTVGPGLAPASPTTRVPAILPEVAKVLDFGIAKLKEARAAETSGESLTGTGVVIGTPEYMSPEQAAGKSGDALDGRSDLYSLGVVMYEMLSGNLPFKTDTPMGMLVAHMHETPRPIQSVRPDLRIPNAVAAVVMKCLEKKPEQRPASAAALIGELERAEDLAPLPTTIRVPAHSPDVAIVHDRGLNPPDAIPEPSFPENDKRWAHPHRRERSTSKLRSLKEFLIIALCALALGAAAWYFGEHPTGPTNQVSPFKPTAMAPKDKGDDFQRMVTVATEKGDLDFKKRAYDDAIRDYQFGLNADPTNSALKAKLQKARNAKSAEQSLGKP